MLCNFEELWIYDFNAQITEPVDRLKVSELATRHSTLNFLFPRAFTPIFGNNWVEATRRAASDMAGAFNSFAHREEPRDRARRFILQCLVAMFSEDIGLLPKSLSTGLLEECRRGASCYDLLDGLFRQMNDAHSARGRRYAGVDYFNGGLFATVELVELTPGELGLPPPSPAKKVSDSSPCHLPERWRKSAPWRRPPARSVGCARKSLTPTSGHCVTSAMRSEPPGRNRNRDATPRWTRTSSRQPAVTEPRLRSPRGARRSHHPGWVPKATELREPRLRARRAARRPRRRLHRAFLRPPPRTIIPTTCEGQSNRNW